MLRKYYGIALILFCIFISILFFFKNQFSFLNEEPNLKLSDTLTKSKMIVEQSIKGVYLVDTQKDNTNWELWAESALSNSETTDWRFNNINVKFYTKKRTVYNVAAKIALVNIKEKLMTFDGGVEITSPNGYVMNAGELTYNFDERKIYSKKPVNVTSEGENITEPIKFKTSQIEVDLKTSVILLKDIESERFLKNKNKMKIKSEEGQLFGNSYKVRYKKNVQFVGFNLELQSHILDLIVDKKNKNLREIISSGNVRVKSGERRINAGRSHFDVHNEVITLTGKPRLTQNNDVMTGEKIVYYSKTKSISVKRPRAKVDKIGLENYSAPVKSK